MTLWNNFCVAKTETGKDMISGESIKRVLSELGNNLEKGQFVCEDWNYQLLFAKALWKDAIEGKKKAKRIQEDYEIHLTVTECIEVNPELESAKERKMKKQIQAVGGSKIRINNIDNSRDKEFIIQTDNEGKHQGIRSLIENHKESWRVKKITTFQNRKEIPYCPKQNFSKGNGRKRSPSRDINYDSRKKKALSPMPSGSNIQVQVKHPTSLSSMTQVKHQNRMTKRTEPTKRVASEIIQSKPKRNLVQASSRPLTLVQAPSSELLASHSKTKAHNPIPPSIEKFSNPNPPPSGSNPTPSRSNPTPSGSNSPPSGRNENKF